MIKKISDRQKIKNQQKKEQTAKRFALFLEIFDERCELDSNNRKFVRCFESGIKLYEEHYQKNSCIYHHLLPKSKYSSYDLCKKNIVIVSPHIHDLAHLDINKVPKVKAKTEELYQLHLNDELC
jgi:hypothetical protein